MKPRPHICVVVPSIREKCWQEFEAVWEEHFALHDCTVIRVVDGPEPEAKLERSGRIPRDRLRQGPWAAEDFEIQDLIHNYSPACRNLGFYVSKVLGAEVILTLDDDCFPQINRPSVTPSRIIWTP